MRIGGVPGELRFREPSPTPPAPLPIIVHLLSDFLAEMETDLGMNFPESLKTRTKGNERGSSSHEIIVASLEAEEGDDNVGLSVSADGAESEEGRREEGINIGQSRKDRYSKKHRKNHHSKNHKKHHHEHHHRDEKEHHHSHSNSQQPHTPGFGEVKLKSVTDVTDVPAEAQSVTLTKRTKLTKQNNVSKGKNNIFAVISASGSDLESESSEDEQMKTVETAATAKELQDKLYLLEQTILMKEAQLTQAIKDVNKNETSERKIIYERDCANSLVAKQVLSTNFE